MFSSPEAYSTTAIYFTSYWCKGGGSYYYEVFVIKTKITYCVKESFRTNIKPLPFLAPYSYITGDWSCCYRPQTY